MAFLRLISLLLCVFLVQGELHPLIKFIENADPKERIIQGTPATLGQFPHQVHLTGGGLSCGGTLISTRHVLTAAHCVTGVSVMNVRYGSINLSSGSTMTASRIDIHPNYNSNTLNNDLAIITLPSDIMVSANANAIRMQRQSELADTHVGDSARVSGWGYTTNNGPISQTLNYAEMRVISNAECASIYGNSVVVSSTICLRGITSSAQNVCNGDSGGPLIIRDIDGEYTLLGVVSFVSSMGCSSGNPSGYVRPVHFLSWINLITGIPIRP